MTGFVEKCGKLVDKVEKVYWQIMRNVNNPQWLYTLKTLIIRLVYSFSNNL